MARERFKTLTEQMFYILLALREERWGAEILEQVRRMTEDRVTIGSGTLYDLLEQFTQEEFIAETGQEGRRKRYILTDKGQALLRREYDRLRRQALDYEAFFKSTEQEG